MEIRIYSASLRLNEGRNLLNHSFRCTAFSYLEGDPDLSFFSVYDGHGGTGVANYLKDHLHEFILEQPEYREGNMEEAILKAFLQVRSRPKIAFKTLKKRPVEGLKIVLDLKES